MRPPWIALWRVDQFAVPDQREALVGDSQEAFTAGQQNPVAQNPGLRGVWPAFWNFQIQYAVCALLTALSLVIGALIVRRARFATVRPIISNA